MGRNPMSIRRRGKVILRAPIGNGMSFLACACICLLAATIR
jgi:hypothetical protein